MIKLKKALLLILISFILISCDTTITTTETENTYPEMDYADFSDIAINSVDDQLTQAYDVYYLYFFGPTCSACLGIKNEALSKIELLENDHLFLCEVNGSSQIHDSIDVTYIPSLVRIVDNNVDQIYTGGSNVLDVLNGLS